MNEEEKTQVRMMRENGCTYRQIADIMHMNVSTISNYCLRHHIESPNSFSGISPPNSKYRKCPICGRVFLAINKPSQQFCSEKCRRRYWQNERQDIARLEEEADAQKTLQKELDFLAKKSDEWLDDEICRREDKP